MSLSIPCLAQTNSAGDWNAFAKLGGVLRDLAGSDQPLAPHTPAVKFRKFLTSLIDLLNKAYEAVTGLSKTASEATCSVNEEVEIRLVAADSVKIAFVDLSRLVKDFSGYLEQPQTREAAVNVAESLQQLAFDKSGWLGSIRRFCFLSPSDRQRFLLQLGLGADAIRSLRQPTLALFNDFER